MIIEFGVFFTVLSIAIITYWSRILDIWGVILATILGFYVYLAGGFHLFLSLLLFHIFGGIITRYKYIKKRSKGIAEDKDWSRGWKNVLSNGFWVAAYLLLHSEGFVASLGGLATAIADTFATEVGLLSRKKPRLITNPLREVEHGASGGVTAIGYLGGILGIFLMLLPETFSNISVEIVMTTVAGGIVGCTVDSILGATIQGLYRCEVCNSLTERKIHCGARTKKERGFRVIDNNIVNFISTGIGGMVSLLLFMAPPSI